MAEVDTSWAQPSIDSAPACDPERQTRWASEAPVARTLMFTDIVGSTNLVEAIGDEAWMDLLRWHDELLRGRFREHNGEEVKHAGDGFFVAFPDASSAVTCAVAIQQSLAEHRRANGFVAQYLAPSTARRSSNALFPSTWRCIGRARRRGR